MLYGYLIAATVMTLDVCQGLYRLQAFFLTDKRVIQSLCHSRASSKYSVSCTYLLEIQ